MKTCVTCGETKPIGSFTHRKREPDGRHRSCRFCTSGYSRQYRRTPEDPKRKGEYGAKWRRRNLVKKAAHMAVTRAVKRGELTRPAKCERCGRGVRLHAHHEDYERRLDVVWLCGSCHALTDHTGSRASAFKLQSHTDHTFVCEACGVPLEDTATAPAADEGPDR